MAKIMVFDTVKKVRKEVKDLHGKMDSLEKSIDGYLIGIEKMKKSLVAQQQVIKEKREEQQKMQRQAPRASKPQGNNYGGQQQRGSGQPFRPSGQQQRGLGQPFRPSGQQQRGSGQRGGRGNLVENFISKPIVADKIEEKPLANKTYDANQRNKNRRNVKNKWDDKGTLTRGVASRYKRKNRRNKRVAKPVIMPERKKAFTMGETITVKELSENIGVTVAALIKSLMGYDILATINQELDYETASMIAEEHKISLEKKIARTLEEQIEDLDSGDIDGDLIERPPIVTIMGHVDHGKTTLLDAIRNASVAETEAGGITQHIGAYQAEHNDGMITFIDTPGHEAFTSMRSRGAQVTDIAILVVAADDGVMPQTVESINHAKAANVPIIVAINKIDLPDANPQRVMQELTEHGILVEEWGGDTIAVPVSAITGEGIDTLMEMILLQSEILELAANPDRKAKGTIIEAELDPGRGPVATVLIQNGVLRVGDSIVAGSTTGRVRAMLDHTGARIEEAGPSVPVEVMGLSDVPIAGDILISVEDDKLAKQVAEERRINEREDRLKSHSTMSLDELFNQIQDGVAKDLNIIVKADVQGSVEAVKQALERLTNDEVRVRCIHGGVGAINESDVFLAKSNNAIIIGFNIRPANNAVVKLIEAEGIDMRTYRIIYNAIEDVEAAMIGMLDPEFKDVIIGHAQVRATFKVPGIGTIGGCYVTDGKITRASKLTVVRDGIVIYEGEIGSLKRFKDDVSEVNTGYECGIGLENFNDIKENDVLEAYITEEIKRTEK